MGETVNLETMSKFVPESAVAYGMLHDWTIPEKPKNRKILAELVGEYVVNENGDESGFHCDNCNSLVLPSDEFCWFCGDDITDDETGGFTPLSDDEKVVFLESEDGDSSVDSSPKKSTKAEAKKPVAKKPVAKKQAAKKPEAKKPEAKKPEAKKPEAKKPEAKKPAAKKLEAKKLEAKKQTAKNTPKKADGEQPNLPMGDEKSPILSLEEYTERIKELVGGTGKDAWMIGKYLIEIRENRKFKDADFNTLREYISAETSLGWITCREYARAAAVMERDVAGALGVSKMRLVTCCPDVYREQLMKVALPSDKGGKGAPTNQVEMLLKELRKKAKADNPKSVSSRGRKSEPNKKKTVHDLINDERLSISFGKDGKGEVLIPDTHAKIVVKVYKTKLNLEFVEDEDSSEE